MMIIQHVKIIGGTEKEIELEAVAKGIIAIGFTEPDKPTKYIHVHAYALKMAVWSVERLAQKEFGD